MNMRLRILSVPLLLSAIISAAPVAEIRPLAPAAVAPPGDRWAAQTSPTTVTLAWTRLPNVAE
jgi:hypothetical protein